MVSVNIEETRKKINKILDDPNKFYPYFHKGHFPDNIVRIIGACNKLTLDEAIETYHEAVKRHYHERTGTKPIDMTPYL